MKYGVFIQTNHKQYVGALVAEHAIRRYSQHNDKFDVHIMHIKDFPMFTDRNGQMYLRDGVKRVWLYNDLQSFTLTRFMPPELMNYEGRSVVIDPDVFAYADVWDLFEHDMQDKVLVASFRDESMAEFRQICPDIATSGSEGELTPFVVLSKVGLGWLFRPLAHAVQVPEERSGIHILSEGFVRAAHGRNMKVDAWTINEQEAMRRIIDMGADGIITDYPDRLLAELGRD